MADAHRARAGALHEPDPAAARRADEPPRRRGRRVARVVPEALQQDPLHGLALAGLHERGVHEHHRHAPRPHGLLRGQLRPVLHHQGRGRGPPNEAPRLGAEADREHEGLHRALRSRFEEARPAGAVEGEGARQDDPRRPHAGCRARREHQLLLPVRRRAAAADAAVHRRHLRVPGRQAAVPESQPRHRHGFAHLPRRPERRRQDDAHEAHVPRAGAHGGLRREERALHHCALPPALRRPDRYDADAAPVDDVRVPRRHHAGAVPLAARPHGRLRHAADVAVRHAFGRPEVALRPRVDGVQAAALPDSRRADEPLGHRVDRRARRRHQRLRGRRRCRLPRSALDRADRRRDLDRRRRAGHQVPR
mmetsp:Transcript_26595/g.82225  ORF Transcript_26595/g.82225 Transcript_26595/m.82225 type:complete len:364 (+) Transcript_26595:1011-2102(+)